jgi:hypothetical protein
MTARDNTFGLAIARLVRFPISVSPILVATLFGTVHWNSRFRSQEIDVFGTKLLDHPIVHGFLPQSNQV